MNIHDTWEVSKLNKKFNYLRNLFRSSWSTSLWIIEKSATWMIFFMLLISATAYPTFRSFVAPPIVFILGMTFYFSLIIYIGISEEAADRRYPNWWIGESGSDGR